MGVMVSEVYDALIEAGATKSTARAAAEAIPATEQLATKQDITDLKNALIELRSLLEDWRSVGVTYSELTRSQRELKVELNAERWKSTVVQIVATVALVVILLRLL